MSLPFKLKPKFFWLVSWPDYLEFTLDVSQPCLMVSRDDEGKMMILGSLGLWEAMTMNLLSKKTADLVWPAVRKVRRCCDTDLVGFGNEIGLLCLGLEPSQKDFKI